MSKPTNKPGWNPADSSKIEEPSSLKKSQGWSEGEKPSAKHFNWLMKTVSQWIDHVDSEIDSRISSIETTAGTVTANIPNVSFPYGGDGAPSEYDAGSVLPGSSKTIDWGNGSSQYLRLDENCALTFINGVAGNTYYLRVHQSGGGNRFISSWPVGISWNSGAVPVISTSPWMLDVLGFYFDGTSYFGFIQKGFFNPPTTGLDTKSGYIAGALPTQWARSVQKMNFNADTSFVTVQAEFGKELSTSGGFNYPTSGSLSSGTASTTAGYVFGTTYTGLTTINGSATARTLKVTFANDSTLNSGLYFGQNPASRSFTVNNGTSYALTATTQIMKFTHSTEIATVSTTSGTGYAISASRAAANDGTTAFHYFQGTGTVPINTSKLNYANEAVSQSSFSSPVYGAVASEALQTNSLGYVWGANGSSAIHFASNDKVNDSWRYLGSITATQNLGQAGCNGLSAGYICGGTNSGTTASTAVKKLAFFPETFQNYSTTLGSAVYGAASFEG
jgi:hypothetical protein